MHGVYDGKVPYWPHFNYPIGLQLTITKALFFTRGWPGPNYRSDTKTNTRRSQGGTRGVGTGETTEEGETT